MVSKIAKDRMQGSSKTLKEYIETELRGDNKNENKTIREKRN